MVEWNSLIRAIHDSGRQVAIAVTGGGSGAIAELLRVPGASRSVVEAVVPYDFAALVEFLGRVPQQACSRETAMAMAEQARDRIRRLSSRGGPAIGLGATASLASDRPKRGEHRGHIAVADGESIRTWCVVFDQGGRDRAIEESLLTEAILIILARAAGVAAAADLPLEWVLGPNDRVSHTAQPSDAIAQLVAGDLARLTVLPDGACLVDAPVPRGVLAGSFNPLHAGHDELARIAGSIIGGRVSFEISATNVDKPPLDSAELRRRLRQFAWHATVELTRAATFREKARLLPGTTFVVGTDTAERIVQPKYYDEPGDAGELRQPQSEGERLMTAALAEIAASGCRFLVACRRDRLGRVITLGDIPVPDSHRSLFAEVPADHFRCDLSSTKLRG
jgi:nicotinamide mononucleotide (NMN) deamidase PncC